MQGLELGLELELYGRLIKLSRLEKPSMLVKRKRL